MGNFREATAVTARAEGEFDAELDPQWTVGGNPHGGYLLALLGRAAAAESSRHPHLTAISGSFSRPPRPGPVQISVEVLRIGTSLTQLRARLTQSDRPCVEALITQGTLDDEGPWWSGAQPIDIPPEADCVLAPSKAPGGGFDVALLDVVEQRLDPRLLGFTRGEPSREGVLNYWQRLRDGSDWDPLSLLVAVDPVPPVSYDLGLAGWVPTIQLSSYIRRLPVPGPVRVRMAAADVSGNRMDETVQVWDAKDRLVAQATQIAAVRTPR